MIIVSACLLGLKTRYDGKTKAAPELVSGLANMHVIPICPEQLGGLPTPRPPASILYGNGIDVLNGKAKVISESGEDVTPYFLKGAKEALKLAKMFQVNCAILKSKSPSCGLSPVIGVTAALLLLNGIKIKEMG
ncbi:hypothetical protein DBT_1772 [Dissulfuribacter thermophilus]|uniref:Uncharacterized protein n=1 Tax=Dissulfuribacter thermophilus TaxID=1156395 RepID=A0A1B9F456_9BACT|nr:DUF523 domain-containing protein [Dissulfuribacter thermophilus]OCC14712.1 hypothetical protein DBT_1772 [Dissulfuribacter thermophilus]